MSKEEEEIQAFYVGWADYLRGNPAQRRGQALFNHLHDVRPDLANQLRGTDLDPFYDNSKVVDALEFIQQHWNPTRS